MAEYKPLSSSRFKPFANVVAQQFWRTVIEAYTSGNYTETLLEDEDWQGIVQSIAPYGKSASPVR